MGKGDNPRPVNREKFGREHDRIFRGEDVRVGNWLQTSSNNRFWPLSPRPGEITIQDVAHALSNVCRYGGHCREFYSVAQHSVLVSENVAEPFQLWGLLHDASEAYIGDMISPLKHDKVWAQGFRDAEDRLMAAVVEAFELEPATMPPEVDFADKVLLVTEVRDLMGSLNRVWCLGHYPDHPPLDQTIVPVPPREAKAMFLDRFYSLMDREARQL